MASVTWTNSSGGNWATGTNWSSNPNPPASGDDVTIGVTGSYVVTLNTTIGVNSLTVSNTSAELAVLSGGVGTIATTINDAGAIVLQSGGSLATTSGGLNITGNGVVAVDGTDVGGSGGSNLAIGGTLSISSTNGNALNIGNGGITSADTVTASGLNSTGQIDITGNSTARSTLDITSGTASFGTANTETGVAFLSGNALLEFASGQINTIAGQVQLSGGQADIADAGSLTTNSALTGLSSVTGDLFLQSGASISTSGGLSDSGLARISLDGGDIGGNGGSSLSIGGALTITSINGNSFNVGSTSISSADVATAQTLTLNSASEITIGGSSTARSTLDITSGTASFGTANTETGTTTLNGNALLEFASGQINTIAGQVQLVSSQADIADAGSLTTNSALTGLNSVTGNLFEQNGASIATSGGLSDSGNARISLDGPDIGGTGGSSLSIGGGLTITSSNGNSFNVGSTSISSADVATAQTLTLNSASEITIGGSSTARSTLDITSGTASFGTANTETGSTTLNGNALLEFASGQINTIAGQVGLVSSGADIADAGSLTTNSALTGLNSVTGNLFEQNGASIATSGGLSDSGLARISLDGGDIGGNGGSSLSIGGGLTITSTNGNSFNVGSTGISSADVATAQTLTLNSASEITIGGSSTARSTLDITSGTASFGTANTETGTTVLNGNALLEFASGQINTIAGEVALVSSQADIADAGSLTTNSALTGLNSVTGDLFLQNGASISTSGGLSDSGLARISLDGPDIGGTGGSSLSIGGGLTITSTNGNGFNVGGTGISSADVATAQTLTLNSASEITIGGSSTARSTLDITSGTASFGTANTETGTTTLNGNALLEFASGQINTIAGQVQLIGSLADIADAGSLTTNSALTGLNSVTGNLLLQNGASIATSGGLSDSGNARISLDGPDIGGTGGSSLSIGGGLTITSTNGNGFNVGYSNITSADTVTATGLTNSGNINLAGGSSSVTGNLLINGNATNTGTVLINNFGNLTVTGPGIYSQAGGTTQVGTATSSSSGQLNGTVNVTGGILDGTGKIVGTIDNHGGGTVIGGLHNGQLGTLTIQGVYNQTGTGIFEADLASGNTASVLNETGGAIEINGGELLINPSITLAAGQTYTIMTFGSNSLFGEFSSVVDGAFTGDGSHVDIGGGLTVDVNYNDAAGNIQLAVVATPASNADTWTTTTGTWTTAGDWTNGVPTNSSNVVIGSVSGGDPTLNEDATINSLSILANNTLDAGGQTLTVATTTNIAASGTLNLRNFNVDGAVTDAGNVTVVNGGVIDLTNNTMTVSGGLTVSSGEIYQGTLAGAGTIQNTGTATLDNVTIASGATFTSLNATTTNLYETITVNGSLDIDASNNGTNLRIFGPVTLDGTGFLTLSSSSENSVAANNNTDTLTIASGFTVQGGGSFGQGQMGINNQGVIDANVAATLNVQPNSNIGLVNTGTMEATSGGTLQLIGAGFNNNGGLIDAANGSIVALNSASIAGGNFTTTGTGVITTEGSNTSSVTSITLTSGSVFDIVNSSTLDLTGTITDNGTINLEASSNGTDLRIFGPVTLTGTGSLTLSNSSNNSVAANNNADTLTISNGFTVQGAGAFGQGQMGINNQGLIDANVSSTLTVAPNANEPAINTGTMEASNGGTLQLENSFNNAGGVIQALAGSFVNLNATSITGGTLTTIGSGVIENISGGNSTLATLTISTGSDVVLLNATTTTLEGTITDNGTINLDASANGTDLRISGPVTLTGSGSLTLSNSSNNSVAANNNADTLTISNGFTVQGAGAFGQGQMGINNQGLIDANVSSTLTVAPNANEPAINTGTMEASNGGTLQLENSFNNAGGVIQALAGSFVNLNATSITGGTLTTIGSGVIENISGGNSTLATLTISTGSDVVLLNATTTTLEGTITDNGTINLDASANGTDLRISGPVTLTGSGSLTLSNSSNNSVQANNDADTLTISSGFTVQGAGGFGQGLMGINNQGLIDANVASTLNVESNANEPAINTGTMEASGGGTLQLINSVNNAGGLIQALTGSVVELDSASIAGGTLTTAGTGIITTESGNTSSLTTITLSSGSIFDIVNNSTLNLTGTITDNGTINLAASSNGTSIRILGPVTLAGTGSLTLSNSGSNSVAANNDADTLTISSGFTVQGAGTFGQGQMGINNQGLIDANVSSTLNVESNSTEPAINTGTMEASGGGTLQILLNVNNAGGLIQALTGSVVALQSASIAGGTLTTTGTGVITTEAGNTSSLTTTTLSSGSVFDIVNNSTLNLTGTITDNGTINLAASSNGTSIRILGPVTLAGTGSLTLSNSGSNSVAANNDADTLTISSGFTVQGGGALGQGQMGLINAGIIDADVSTNLVVQPNATEPVTNQATGTMEGSGGTLVLQNGTFTNDGTVQALDAGAVTYASSATNTNNSGGTLTGGIWAAIDGGHGATLTITGGAVVTDAAKIVLSGANSTFLAGSATLESSLTTIAGTGELDILNDRNYTSSLSFTDGGIVQLGGGTFTASTLVVSSGALFAGFGTVDPLVLPSITNNGTIDATGGHLTVSNPVTGSGLFQIGAAAELELGGNTAENVDFIGASSEARLDMPTSYGGTFGGFATGDTLELANTDATSAHATFNSGSGISTLTVTLSSGGPILYDLTGDYSADFFTTTLVHGNADTDIQIGTGNVNPPIISAPTSVTIGVGQLSAITGVSLSETGSTGGETFTATLTDTHGDLIATGTGVSGSGTTSLTITGSLAQVNSDLATLKDTDGTTPSDTITLNASDSFSNVASPQTIAVTVNGLPVISAPSAATVGQSQPTSIGNVSLSESGNTAGETFTVTLTDAHGDLMATGAGVSGSGSMSLTIVGSLSQVNSDLQTLKDTDGVTPSDTITLNASDSFNNTATTQQIAVTVNGLPVITAPPSATVGNGQATAINGVSLSESGNTASETFSITLSDSHGDLTATGSGVSGSGSMDLIISGSLSQVNSDLMTLKDTDGTTPSDTITLNASDSFGNIAATQHISVSVTSGPVITAPTTLTLGVGEAETLTGFSLSESGSTGGETFTETLSDIHGNLSATGPGVSGGGTSLTISGSLGQVNSDLLTLKDTDGTTPSDTITLNASDSFGNTATTQQVAVTVNGVPVLSEPTTLTLGVGEAETLTGFSLSETGNTIGETFTETLTDTHGVLSATGPGVSGSGSMSLTITGSLTQVNSDLLTLKDTDGTTGSDTITLNASDSFGNTAATQQVAVTVNGVPVLSEPTTLTLGVGEAETLTGFSLSETGNTIGETFTETLTDTHGVLSATGPGVSGSGSMSLTITGSLSQVNSDLLTLKDTDGTTPSDTITLNASDSFGNTAATQQVAVTVNGVPVLSEPTTLTLGVGEAETLTNFSLSETGNTIGETFTETLSDIHGNLSATGTGVSGSGSMSLTITGSLSQVNSDLMTLKDTDGTTPSDTITLNASDSFGNTAATQQVAVTVNGLPVITAPSTATVAQSTATSIGGVSLSETGNTSGETFSVTLVDAFGDLSATGTGVSGSGSTSLTITGSLSQVNSDLVTLMDTDSTTPSDTITLNASDSFGNNASQKQIAVTVTSAGPVLGGAGNTVFWTQSNPPTTIDSGLTVADPGSSTLSGATVSIAAGFLSGDQLDFTNQNGITGSYNATTGVLILSGSATIANYQTALESVGYNSTSSNPTSAGADSVRTISWQAANGASLSNTVNSTIDVGQIYNLTTGVDNIQAGAGNDIFIATTGTLNAGDVVDGGGGTNTLELEGGGTFNLAAPTTLADIQFITAQEGQPAYGSVPSQVQTITLRNGLNATVNVAAATLIPGDNKVPTITIVGANNDDVINLASGNDIVTLGSAAETVNGGSGVDVFYATASTIGATINGGSSGQSQLLITGGGIVTMGSNITNVTAADLEAAATPYQFFANAIAGFTVDDLSTATADTINAGGAGQTLTGGGAGKETMVGFGSGVTTYKDSATAFNHDTVDNFSSNDQIDVTGLKFDATTSVQWLFNSSTSTPSGTLEVFHNSALATSITLFGASLSATTTFTPTADSAGTGTLITDPNQHQVIASAH